MLNTKRLAPVGTLILCLFFSSYSYALDDCDSKKSKISSATEDKILKCFSGSEGLNTLAILVDGNVVCAPTQDWQWDEEWAEKKLQIYYQLIEAPKKPAVQKVLGSLQKQEVDARKLQFSKDEKCFPDNVAYLVGRHSTPRLTASCGTFYPVGDEGPSKLTTDFLSHVHLGKETVTCENAIDEENRNSKRHSKIVYGELKAQNRVFKTKMKAERVKNQLEKRERDLQEKRRKLGTAAAPDPKVNVHQKDQPFRSGTATTQEAPAETSANKAAP
jgi:hypothetical protein